MVLSIRPRSPIARRFDPATSHEAAREITRSGKRDRQSIRVYDALCQWPDRTSAELAALMQDDRYMVARRLPELRNAGWIGNEAPRRCTVTGRRALIWRPLNAQDPLPLHLG